MILDTAALVALLRDEPEAAEFENLLESSATNEISAASNALAKACQEPLLFKGNDFAHTDVDRARP